MPRFRPLAASALTALLALISASCGSSGPTTITVTPSNPALDDGDSIVLTASIDGGKSNKPVTWTLNGPGSLANSTFPSATYTAPNILPSLFPEQVPLTVALTSNPAVSATVTVTVNPRPGINTQALPAATVGQPYSTVVPVAGGTAPFQWSICSGVNVIAFSAAGTLPDGLTLNPSTGTVSGTPTGAGTWYFGLEATDIDNNSAYGGFLSIQVNPVATASNPVPFLNQPLNPTAIAPGSAAFTLTVSGTGFDSGATINFNGLPLTTTFVDAAHLSTSIPAANVAAAGTASITVTNPGTNALRSNVVYFPVGPSKPDVTFASVPNTFQPYISIGIVAGDFNEDGKPDLALAFSADVSVLLGNGDGTFTTAPGSPVRLAPPPYDNFATPFAGPIVAGDFNHSGHLGVAVGLPQNESADIFLGHGDGTLSFSTAGIANSLGQPVTGIAVADANGDGNLDLAFSNQFLGQNPLDLGYGDGAFTPAGSLFVHFGWPTAVAFGDFNGDGKLDVVTSNGGSPPDYPYSGFTVVLGSGDGNFTASPGAPVSLGTNIVGETVGDFNGDAKLDVAFLDSTSNSLYIVLGNGDGTFGPALTYPTGSNPYTILAADFNNDGKLDLAIANTGSNTVTLLLGNGDGTFTEAPSSPYPVGQGPTALAAADFNNDGKLDLAVANSTSGTITILLQQ
jgi:hypothetical protein